MKDIFLKEIKRVLGDRKMIFSLIILPAILVIGIYALMGWMMDGMINDVEGHRSIVYIQNAPEGLTELMEAVEFQKNAELQYLAADADVTEIKDQILKGDVDLLVTFEPDFMAKYLAYQKAGDSIPTVELSYNSTENYSASANSKFTATVLSAMEMQLLQTRFSDLESLKVFETKENLIQKEDKANGQFLSTLLPYLITFALFSSAMGLCVDAIAGEKERGTMASLLITPIKRSSIIYGKILGLSILSMISATVYAVSMLISMPSMMKGMAGDEGEALANFSVSPRQAIELLALMISLVLIYVAMLCFISAFARTTKEAQSYVMPIYMVVLVAGMMTMFNSGMKTPTFYYAIPVYGTALSIQGILTNELTLVQFGLSAASNILCSLLFVFLVVKAFNSEKIMLNA